MITIIFKFIYFSKNSIFKKNNDLYLTIMSEDIINFKKEIKDIKKKRDDEIKSLLNILDEEYFLKGRWKKRKISKDFLKYIQKHENVDLKDQIKILRSFKFRADIGPGWYGGTAVYGYYWDYPSRYLQKEKYFEIMKILNLIPKYKNEYLKGFYLTKFKQERDKY